MPTASPSVSPLPTPATAFDPSASDGDSDPPDSSRRRRLLVYAVIIVSGAVVGFLGGRMDLLDGLNLAQWTPVETAIAVVSLPVGMLLIVAIHEAGHTLAGYLAGFQLQHVSVGPLKLQRTPDGWKARRSQNDFFAGMSHGVPGPVLRDAPLSTVRRGRAIRIAGGAAANVLTGGLALWIGVLLAEETARVAAQFFGVASFFMGVVNLIPFRTGSGLITDGARIGPLLRGTPEADRDVALAIVRAESYGGTRPSDWSPRWVERMLTPRDYGMTDGSTRMLAYRHALDAGRTEDAQAHLAEALNLLDRLPSAQHGGLMVEAAYFEAAHRGDAEKARTWLDRAGGGGGASISGVPSCAAGRAEAAVLLAEGTHDDAQRRIADAESALGEHPVPGTAVAEEAWLQDLARRVPEFS